MCGAYIWKFNNAKTFFCQRTMRRSDLCVFLLLKMLYSVGHCWHLAWNFIVKIAHSHYILNTYILIKANFCHSISICGVNVDGYIWPLINSKQNHHYVFPCGSYTWITIWTVNKLMNNFPVDPCSWIQCNFNGYMVMQNCKL